MARRPAAGVLAALLLTLAATGSARGAEVVQIESPAGSVSCSSCFWFSLGDRGDVVGTVKIDGKLRGVRWTNGSNTLLPPLAGHSESLAIDVAADGSVAGTSSDGQLAAHPVKWSPAGTATDVMSTNSCNPPWTNESPAQYARAMSSGGFVYGDGFRVDPTGCGPGVAPRRPARLNGASSLQLWDFSPRHRTPEVFLAAVSPDGSAALVDYARTNDYGADVPQSPVLLENGIATSLDPCITENGPVFNGYAATFNNLRNSLGPNRTVVGGGVNGPVSVWRSGTCDTLPVPQGTTAADAYAISSTGTIAGVVETDDLHAVLWNPDGGIVVLDDLLPAGSPWKLLAAYDVNDDGWVLATGRKGGVDYPVLVKPGGISIDDVEFDQPAEGTTADATFTIKLDAQANTPVGVHWATADGTAKQPDDYEAASGDVTFQPGQTSKQVTVKVKPGDPPGGAGPTKRFFVNLSQATGPAAIGDGSGVAKIHPPNPLKVEITTDPAKPDVKQTPDGPVPVAVKVQVKVTNTGKVPLDPVTLPDKLTLSNHGEAKTPEFPLKQTGRPGSLELGPLAPGASKTATYTLEASGDGSFDVEAVVLGGAGDENLYSVGRLLFEPDSQVLMFKAELGSRVRSQNDRDLIQAGTLFLVNVTLENRSYKRKIAVDPIYGDLRGNAADGHTQEADVEPTGFAPSGSLDEVKPSKYVTLEPRQKREFRVVVRTAASDAFADEGGGGGGTRAEVRFVPPGVHDVSEPGEIPALAADRVVMIDGSSEFLVGIDESVPAPPPFNAWEATWNVSTGVIAGVARATFGLVRGIVWDLPRGLVTLARNVPSASFYLMDRIAELAKTVIENPGVFSEVAAVVYAKVLQIYEEGPLELIGDTLEKVKDAVDRIVYARFSSFYKAWFAGDWRAALNEFWGGVAEGVVNIASLLAPAVLARFPKVAALWNTTKAALYEKVGQGLSKFGKVVSASRAVGALRTIVKPGYVFSAKELAKIYGVSSKEAAAIARIAKENRISIVFRSRASQSIKFIEKKVATMKPFWIKAKNVNEIDVQYLGFKTGEIGKVILREPPALKKVQAKLAKAGHKPGEPFFEEVVKRHKQRLAELEEDLVKMKKWAKKGEVEGKWPWQENGVDPRVQSDETFVRRFRLKKVDDGGFLPEVYLPPPGGSKGWKFITGDIDLIAVTKADGSALSDAQHVAVLKKLRDAIGAQHPESATWVKDGKFWFNGKRNYLLNDGECCLAQIGPDGLTRAVEFNEGLSAPETWTKLAYRIFWNGGYQAPAGG